MLSIVENLTNVRNCIENFEKKYNRPLNSVRLIAVSKTKSIESILEIFAAKQKDFAENYLQEALEKINALKDNDICWHYIGAIQSNKTRDIAENFQWVHTVSREKIAERLNAFRPKILAPLNVCIQVNISHEPQKAGISFDALEKLVHYIQTLPNLKLRGLMAIAEDTQDLQKLSFQFQLIKNAFDKLNKNGFCLDTLSIGMSQDLELAIANGSTMVRVGSAIFGAREKKGV